MDLVENVLNSVHVYDGNYFICTCVAISKNTALTAKHCIEDIGIEGVIIDNTGHIQPLTNMMISLENDIGLLTTDDEFSNYLETENFSKDLLQVGEPISTYGYGCEHPKRIVLEEHQGTLKYVNSYEIAISGHACGGDSGGPALRTNGKIIGITARVDSLQNATEVYLTPIWAGKNKVWESFK